MPASKASRWRRSSGLFAIVSRPNEILLMWSSDGSTILGSVPRGKVLRSEPERNARGMGRKGMRERIESWRLRGGTRSRHAHTFSLRPLETAPGTLIPFNQTPAGPVRHCVCRPLRAGLRCLREYCWKKNLESTRLSVIYKVARFAKGRICSRVSRDKFSLCARYIVEIKINTDIDWYRKM